MMQIPNGLEYAELSTRSLDRLREVTPSWHRISNPIDLTPAIQSVGPDRAYEAVMDVLIGDENVDAGLVSIAAFEGNDPDLRAFRRNIEKPILFSVIGNNVVMAKITEELRRIGYPVFPFMRRAMIVLHGMYQVSRVIRQE
jgi:acyl-CoA synthetase (NDP forming)